MAKFKTKEKVTLENNNLNSLANKLMGYSGIILLTVGVLANQQILQPYTYYISALSVFPLWAGLTLKSIMLGYKKE